MNLLTDKSISIVNRLSERLDGLYPDPDDKEGLGIIHWKGKPIIPIKEWRKLSISDSLHFFPDGLIVIALLPEGHSVDVYDESIFPYHDGDGIPRPGTEERKFSLDRPESKLSAPTVSYGRQELRKLRLKQKKKTLLRFGSRNTKNYWRLKRLNYRNMTGQK